MLNTELLPLDNIKSGVVIEIYLEDSTACVESDSTTTPVITVSNVIFHIERLEVADDYRQFIKNYVATWGLQLGFHTWERYVNALTTGSTQNILINHRSSSMNGMLNFLIDSSALNNMTVNDKFLNWISNPTSQLNTTSLQINGTTFPDEPITVPDNYFAQPFQAYCQWIQKWRLSGLLDIAPPITNQAYLVDRFVQVDV